MYNTEEISDGNTSQPNNEMDLLISELFDDMFSTALIT
jgi:hypothetical protein